MAPRSSEFAFAEFAQPEIRRLEELRLETVEGRIEAILRLGRHGAVVAELGTRSTRIRFASDCAASSCSPCTAAGRQAEALDVYREGRTLLSDQLGLEPGTELQRLERAILEQDPALDAPRGSRRGAGERRHPACRGGSRRRLRNAAVAVVLLAAVAIAAAAPGYLLVSDGSRRVGGGPPPALVAIDPTSNRVVASIKVGSRPTTVAAGAGGVWVGDTRDGTVTRVDPETREVETTIGIGAPVVDLAIGAGGVWAATGSFGEVVQIDPDVAAVVQRVSLGDPDDPIVPQATSVGVGDGRVWVGAFDGLARIDPRSGDVVERIDSGVRQRPADRRRRRRRVGDDVRQPGQARRGELGPRDGRVLRGGLARPGRARRRCSLGRWRNGGSKVDSVTGAARQGSTRPAGDVVGIAYGDGSVWLASFSKARGRPGRPETGAVEARIATGGSAFEAAFHDGLLWVRRRRERRMTDALGQPARRSRRRPAR